MGLINTDVEININGRIASYYEDLGYKIPKYLIYFTYSKEV